MIEDWHPVERMQRRVAPATHFRFEIVKIERDILVRQDEPDDVDEGADRKAVHGDDAHDQTTPELRSTRGRQAPARNAIATMAPYTNSPVAVTTARPTRPAPVV